MLINKLLGLNLKGLKIAFFAGSTVGAMFGCVAGMGIGAALGALFAPKAGKELRQDIADGANCMMDTAKEKGSCHS